MPRLRTCLFALGLAVVGVVAVRAHVAAEPKAVVSPQAAAFLAENDAAMVRMHRDMHVEPTGDVDRDFAAMMIPHHQGAIDMAKAVLRYGKHPQIRRLAQEIIIEQQQEIAVMRMVLSASRGGR